MWGTDQIGREADVDFIPYLNSDGQLEYAVGLNNEFNGSGYWSTAEIIYDQDG